MNILFKSFEYKAIKFQVKNEEAHPRSSESGFALSSTWLCDTSQTLMPLRASAVSSVQWPSDNTWYLHNALYIRKYNEHLMLIAKSAPETGKVD